MVMRSRIHAINPPRHESIHNPWNPSDFTALHFSDNADQKLTARITWTYAHVQYVTYTVQYVLHVHEVKAAQCLRYGTYNCNQGVLDWLQAHAQLWPGHSSEKCKTLEEAASKFSEGLSHRKVVIWTFLGRFGNYHTPIRHYLNGPYYQLYAIMVIL